jgi:hypothetical protein
MALHQNVLALIWFQVRMMPIVGSRNRSGSSYCFSYPCRQPVKP